MRTTRSIAFLLGLAGLVPPAAAMPTVDDLVAQAVAKAPGLSVSTAKEAAAYDRIAPASSLPDPSIELSGLAMGLNPPGPRSMLTLELKQELPYPGKRDARRDVLAAEADIRRLQTDELLAEVAYQVRTSYAQGYAIDGEIAAVEMAGTWIDTLGNAIIARYGVGEGSRMANLKLLSERSRLRQRLSRLRAERVMVAAELSRLTVRPIQDFDGPFMAPPEVAVPNLSESTLAATPELKRRQAQIVAAGRMVHLAEREERPDFMVAGGGGVDAMGGPVVMAKIGLSLPVWGERKQRALTRASRHDVSAMEGEYADALSRTVAEFQGQKSMFEQAMVRVKEVREVLIPASEASLTTVLQAFATRQTELTMVLSEVTELSNEKSELARAEADRFIAWAAIERLTSPTRTAPGGR